MNLMTKEDSYAERRQLFRNIWDTAMQMNEKDAANIMNKPKVIKTLRLDEVDRCIIGKGKKEKIRTLRTVCKKILDFCDRQDEDDRFYAQVAGKQELRQHNPEYKHKKTKTHRGRKKVKKSKSLFTPLKSVGDTTKPTTSERKNRYPRPILNRTRIYSPIKTKRPIIVRRTSVRHDISKAKSAFTEGNNAGTSRRKIVKKKRGKRKKPSVGGDSIPPPKPSGTSNNVHYVSTPSRGHAIVRRIKELLKNNKITVAQSTK
ncbi:uncharacterized protein LOC118263249 isoform X1 [Spodoptera frugiperda]|uniref:Uncharacterized protein LOC118263249 isoform X1 n=1 Tax=Spodoptera frugiperda TaxID=7108 RepID=A0A9R0EFP7_SPOFR|nr:uncharacterized protein LOC118263249 isoform X1 [Spodoptera frugiperda]